MLRASTLVSALLLVGAVRHRRSRTESYTTCAVIGCAVAYNSSAFCQCNNKCKRYNNCCSDYDTACSPSCALYGCGTPYDRTKPCQCNDKCSQYGNCCGDYGQCSGAVTPAPTPVPPPTPAPAPTPPPPAPGRDAYWADVDLSSKNKIQSKMTSGVTRLSYTPGVWEFYKVGWSNLPGLCNNSIYDIYSSKCWTPGTGQCGSYRREGDCYNREHSWPKSWWGGSQNSAYTDIFHVMPSDGYVNNKRSSHPFGEVGSASYVSREGHKAGSCTTPGYSGTCFEPADKSKGLVARGHFYMATRYAGQLSGGSAAVSNAELLPWTVALMLKWHEQFPPQGWELEFNNRAQEFQGNRNPFIDYPHLAREHFAGR